MNPARFDVARAGPAVMLSYLLTAIACGFARPRLPLRSLSRRDVKVPYLDREHDHPASAAPEKTPEKE